jgi:dipeptide transport system permease protein
MVSDVEKRGAVSGVSDASSSVAVAAPGGLASFWASFSENKGAVLGLGILTVIVLLAIFADFVAPHPPLVQYRDSIRIPPVWDSQGTWRFVLGTDGLGRDTLSRLIHGARVSLFIGLVVMSVSFVLGAVLGLVSAFSNPVVDTVISRIMDLLMSVPGLVLAILIVAVLGPSQTNTIVAVTVVFLPRYVRLVRASALAEMGKDYVTSAKVIGVSKLYLMFVTVLPNCLAPLIVQSALGVSEAILEAAALGFLGLGAQPPTPEWGTMLADAREFIRSDPWIVTLPGLAILVTVVSINLMGDGLRDALDPKMQRS